MESAVVCSIFVDTIGVCEEDFDDEEVEDLDVVLGDTVSTSVEYCVT